MGLWPFCLLGTVVETGRGNGSGLLFSGEVVMEVKAASAKSIRNDEFHQQSSAPLEQSPQQKLCPPGLYMKEAIGGCATYTNGIDYTNHSNALPSCLLCMTCKSGEEEKNCCILIEDTKCQCKSGTFRGEDAPEFCQKCSTRCPDGKDMDMNCTLRSNIKCVDQESSTLAHGEAPVPGELTTMSQRLPITPSPSSGSSRLVIGIVTGIVITVFLIGCLFNECWHKVIGFSSIWRPQTLSNCITAKPRVDTVFDAFSLCDSSLLFQMGPHPLLEAGLSADLDCPQLLWVLAKSNAQCLCGLFAAGKQVRGAEQQAYQQGELLRFPS
ncbi:TPA: hypothetical protein BOS_9071 [Bos taurus]|nr:TPA: hypothetical protein BOS_9071 [Bos taurus]